MQITFLGTGTSHGVPKIGCSCKVCSSKNGKNRRLRSSILITKQNHNLLIDPSIDFRKQALTYNIKILSDILLTHIHADHVFGLDDLRVYNKITQNSLNLYLTREYNKKIRDMYPYLYKNLTQKGGGVAQINNVILKPFNKYNINTFDVTPIPVKHGNLDIFGYKIENIAYITDASFISEIAINYLRGVDILIINALRLQKHSTHFSIEEAIEVSKQISPQRTFFTHMCHDIDHDKINKSLPDNIELAFDGLILKI